MTKSLQAKLETGGHAPGRWQGIADGRSYSIVFGTISRLAVTGDVGQAVTHWAQGDRAC